MIFILYNDSSNRGRPIKEALRLEKKISKQKKEFVTKSILEIGDKMLDFHNNLTEKDELILIGGDGTLHNFFNQIAPNKINYRVFVKGCGRGNDFARDYKKHKLFEITHLVNDLPTIIINEKETHTFINGIGMGIDSMVCAKQLSNARLKIKQSYFNVALKIFKTFKPYPLDLVVDGKEYHYKKVWFFVCNNGCYFGGGMKITPKAKREDDHLDICVVHDIKLWSLLMVFPLVFLGFHRFFRKKYMDFIPAKHVLVYPKECDILQKDGEISNNVKVAEIKR